MDDQTATMLKFALTQRTAPKTKNMQSQQKDVYNNFMETPELSQVCL